MATIYDVAKQSGVSIASVSLVMKDPTTNRVGRKRKELILRVAQELAYTPNIIARALSEGSTRILGLFAPMRQSIFANHFIAEVLSGLQSVAARNGYDLMIYSHLAERGRVSTEELAKCQYVDGIAVLNTRVSSKQDIESTIRDLGKTGRPFVMMNAYSGRADINYVGVDDLRTGRIAAEYLIKRDRKRFAVLAGTKRSPISSRFLAGVRAGMAGTSIRITDKFCAYGEYDLEIADRIANHWFSAPKIPDAILVIDDQMVPPLYRAARNKGLTIGKDIAIISRGSRGFAESLEPRLTTFDISGWEIGDRAAQVLLQSLGRTPAAPQRIILSPPLIENASA